MDALPGEDRRGWSMPSVRWSMPAAVPSLRATVANRDAVLRPGMFARVQLQFAQDQALVVPEAADALGSGAICVPGARRRGRAARRDHRRAPRGLVEILTGVGEGDQLVVAGLQRVTDGAPVQIVGDGA